MGFFVIEFDGDGFREFFSWGLCDIVSFVSGDDFVKGRFGDDVEIISGILLG